MTNLLQSGAAWLGGQLQTHAGRTVSIRQGVKTVASIVASVAKLEYMVESEEGFPLAVQFYDWTFVAADLVAAGIELREGAIVTETLSGVAREYFAAPVGKRPCVEDLDTSGILLTLHTNRSDE